MIPEAKGAGLSRVGPRRVRTMQRAGPVAVATVEVVACAARGLGGCCSLILQVHAPVVLLIRALQAPSRGLGAAPR